jgi:hypothetical protein
LRAFLTRPGRGDGPERPVAHFCTYFDRRYLVRGLALYDSLLEYARPFQLHVLCLDGPTYRILGRLALPGVRLISLAALEKGDPTLARARHDRTRVEYYFTCTPSLPLFVLNHTPGVEVVTYLDADLYFFGDPAPVAAELGSGSILIIPHRFPEYLKHAEAYGIYNVGLLSFRNDARGRACLTWWRERCLEWCHDRLEGERFADQGYLNDWPARFPGVVVLQHWGVNLAPWNVARYRLQLRQGTVLVDAEPLLCYHFHGLRVRAHDAFDLGLEVYHTPLNDALEHGVYVPYLRKLQSLQALCPVGAAAPDRRPAPWCGPRLVLPRQAA